MFTTRRALLLLSAVAAASLTPAPSQAAAPGALQVRDATPTIAGFAALDVLHDPAGFAVGGILGRPGIRYVAYGVVSNQVRVTTSVDGETWTAPQGATLRDPSGADVPFVIGNQQRVAAAYVTTNSLPHGYKFVIVYAPQGGDPAGKTPNPLSATNNHQLSNLRYAMSANGVEWVAEQPVNSRQNAEPVITAGTFKHGILGPSDLHFNAGKSCWNQPGFTSQLNWGSGSPFDCEFTMAYTAVDPSGNTSVVLAGGVFFADIGLTFRGATAPAITRSAATWTSAGIDRAHIVRQGTGFLMGLSGSTSAQTCVTDAARCSVGTATSATGNTFTPEQSSSPSISATQAESIAGSSPQSVTDLQLDPGAGEERWFVGFDERTFDAFEPIEVGSGPRISFHAPASGFVSASDPSIKVVINDDATTGNGIGIDLSRLSLTWDGGPIPGTYTVTETGIGQITTPGTLVTIPSRTLSTSDGLHTLAVRAIDYDGEIAEAEREILIDRTAGTAVITLERSSGFSFPLNSVYLQGSAVDGGVPTGLLRMRGVVTNPLGQSKVFQQGPAGTNDPHAGFTFSNLGPRVTNGGPVSWSFAWAPPTNDALFWAIPGVYRVQVSTVDYAGNVEGATGANSRSFLLV